MVEGIISIERGWGWKVEAESLYERQEEKSSRSNGWWILRILIPLENEESLLVPYEVTTKNKVSPENIDETVKIPIKGPIFNILCRKKLILPANPIPIFLFLLDILSVFLIFYYILEFKITSFKPVKYWKIRDTESMLNFEVKVKTWINIE